MIILGELRGRYVRYHDTKRDQAAFDHDRAASLGSRRTFRVITWHGRRLHTISRYTRRFTWYSPTLSPFPRPVMMRATTS